MDKQKQLEEMTELMADWAFKNNMYWHEGHAKALAETFAENDYEKIPENAVVLTKEEWQQMKNSLYYSEEALEKKLQKARKETAKKFAERLKEQFADSARLCEQVDEIYKEFTEGKK